MSTEIPPPAVAAIFPTEAHAEYLADLAGISITQAREEVARGPEHFANCVFSAQELPEADLGDRFAESAHLGGGEGNV